MEDETIATEQEGTVEGADTVQGFEGTTAHDHYYQATGINENGLLDVICNCGHGMQIDPTTVITDGKLPDLSV